MAALMFACGNPRQAETIETTQEVYEVIETEEAITSATPPAAAVATPTPTPAAPTTPAPTPQPEPEPEPERVVVEVEEGQESVGTRSTTRRRED